MSEETVCNCRRVKITRDEKNSVYSSKIQRFKLDYRGQDVRIFWWSFYDIFLNLPFYVVRSITGVMPSKNSWIYPWTLKKNFKIWIIKWICNHSILISKSVSPILISFLSSKTYQFSLLPFERKMKNQLLMCYIWLCFFFDVFCRKSLPLNQTHS